ncbi:uncharacterized protein LOC112558164 isoform X2 [Pomacea canaliculata]|uniref:uncharacterized protein LOC112558164 isoform X2 n=1 Tax=Pomacea canaliculata TaxID=400727 RepID=UPI000D7317D6|nr:uncharacterized protein LOC112558164 isoform X2 [Pomacea canaliculata]
MHSQPDNNGQWGHVIYEKLFDPTRTFPGLGHIYTTPRQFQRNSNIAMMGEYLHNYRNFLMDLRMAMRRGKNYESQIICGPLPPHQLPRPQSLPQQANSQQESRQHPHISELSPGLWSVLAEIASPQPQDLRMEFSRLMNVVTSLRMREIWTDKKQHHQQQQQQHQQQHARPAPQGHVTYSRHGFSLPDPVGHRRGVSESEDKSFFSTATSARRHEADEDCIDDILAMTSILTTMNVQSDSSGNSDAASFLSSFPASPLSLSARDPALGSRYLPGIQKNYERLQNSFVPCSNSRVRAGPTYAVGMHRSCEKASKRDDDNEDDDDDIAELIDSARIEMQLEEEEEQEEKQRMQLLIYQLEQSQKQAPVPGESHVVEGQEVSDPLRETRDLEESGGSCQASADNEVSCPDALEEAQRQEMFHHFQQQQQQLSSERAEALDVECEAELLENERQVRFVLRRSTVNHHLNQDLQQNIVATGDSSSTTSPPLPPSLPSRMPFTNGKRPTRPRVAPVPMTGTSA